MQNELIELQTQLAFQEQTIGELNDALTSQQQQLDSLRLELRLLHDKFEEGIAAGESGEFSAVDEKPPHY